MSMKKKTLLLVIALALVADALASYKSSPASKSSEKSPASKASSASKASESTSKSFYSNPSRFLPFLIENKSPVSNLPLSFAVPKNFFEDLIADTVVISNKTTWTDYYCYNFVNATLVARYALQTEQILASLGLSIYDGAVRMIALSLLDRGDLAWQYTNDTLVTGTTYQFATVRMGGNCEGITAFRQANPSNSLCYGGNDPAHTHNNVSNQNAFLNQIISDWYAPPNVMDVRCPAHAWWWNNWQPITGDNVWANLLGPLQSAYLNANRKFSNIKDTNIMLTNAVNVFPTVELMMISSVGAIARAPYNTYGQSGGATSVENCGSTLAAVKFLRQTISGIPNSVHAHLIPRIDVMMANLTSFLRSAYDPTAIAFRTGGSLSTKTGAFAWSKPVFALDCQTWVIAALGPKQIDSWFGAGTSLNIWLNAKIIAGFDYDATDGSVRGVGFSNNSQDRILSGEWTFGAINAVRILRGYYTDPQVVANLFKDENTMRDAVEYHITGKTASGTTAVKYANKRYYIPFGWYANPFPALASTGWAVMVDKQYNPFQLGGSYVYA